MALALAGIGHEFARRTSSLLMFPRFSGLKLFYSRPAIDIHPQDGMVDEQVTIGASGLEPGQLNHKSLIVLPVIGSLVVVNDFDSVVFQVSEQPSLGGTYLGLQPMGLLWGMAPDAKSAKKKARLLKTDPNMHHWVYTFDLCDGNVPNVDQGPGEILASETVKRRFVAPWGLQEVASSQLPLIIEMAGLAPRSVQDRPQLLASHGFAVFDFNYFGAIGEALLTGGPKGENVYLDCQLFYDIVEFARRHPRIDDTRIGISTGCSGGSLVLSAVPRLKGFPVRCISVQRSEDRYSSVKPGKDGTLFVTADFDHHVYDAANRKDYVAPVENLTIPTLFLVCGDDQLAPTEKCMIRAAKRMRQAGNGHLVDFVHLPGAGHLLQSPYLPLCTESSIYLPDVVDAPVYARWGGEPKLHAEAQVKAWQKMLDFFRQHLGPVEPLRRDWLSTTSI
ncbi:acyl-coenzyme A thioesterase 3-like [Diadema antillarum]|uniref:acyl-coenzyme A thioesterase 3-like n=1 Tax=Diadema antillarum TaxID=105358 RepID=UPI003A8677B3